MNFVEEFFENHRGVLSEALQGVGFTDQQTGPFLDEAASGILNSFHHKEIATIIETIDIDDPSRLVRSININSIAANTSMDTGLVASGIEVIAPIMADAFTKNSDGAVFAAASIAWGNFLDFNKKPD